jgi:hypothetical protein
VYETRITSGNAYRISKKESPIGLTFAEFAATTAGS